jgi:hypothetical protein
MVLASATTHNPPRWNMSFLAGLTSMATSPLNVRLQQYSYLLMTMVSVLQILFFRKDRLIENRQVN